MIDKVVQMDSLLEDLYLEECNLLNIVYKGAFSPKYVDFLGVGARKEENQE